MVLLLDLLVLPQEMLLSLLALLVRVFEIVDLLLLNQFQ